jgi:hypothetical protein
MVDRTVETERRQDEFLAGFVGTETAEKGEIHYVDSAGKMHVLPPGTATTIPRHPGTLRLVLVSDTHEQHEKLSMPPGDIFVHCGDILLFNSRYRDATSIRKLQQFNEWVGGLPYMEKVVIGGNHDFALQNLGKEAVRGILNNCIYLENESVPRGSTIVPPMHSCTPNDSTPNCCSPSTPTRQTSAETNIPPRFSELGRSKLRIFGCPASVANPLPAWRGGGPSQSPNRCCSPG